MPIPSEPVTATTLDEWADQTFESRMQLHLDRASPSQVVRDVAFARMSQLLQEAVSVVRLASRALRAREGRPAG